MRLQEAKYINKSLLALGRVIARLVAHENHIPYRDSKLTRLLQNSIGGNSRTALVVCLSPAQWNAQESLTSLRFGMTASKIQNTATVNETIPESELESALNDAVLRVHKNQRACVS